MLAALAACSGSSTTYVAHDPCATLAITAVTPTAAQRVALDDALALWRGRGVLAFDRAVPEGADAPEAAGVAPGPTPGATIEIRFDDAAPAFHGIYDPAADRVLINRGITDRAALAIVIAHELGHAFGLVHIAATARVSLMNPGNVVTPPTDGDQRALEALWGACR